MTKSADRAGAGETNGERVALTEAEWAIMRVVWEQGPCAAGTVQEALQETRNWAYSTVKTMLDRMVKKGLLHTHSIRNLQLFAAAVTQEQAKRSEIVRALRCAFNGALTPMVQFLLEHEELSREELSQLRDLIDAARSSRESTPGEAGRAARPPPRE